METVACQREEGREARSQASPAGPTYLQPLLRLLPALQGQHQDLSGALGEAQLVPLVPAVLGHVDDTADVQCQPQMRLPVLGALVTLDRHRTGRTFWSEDRAWRPLPVIIG